MENLSNASTSTVATLTATTLASNIIETIGQQAMALKQESNSSSTIPFVILDDERDSYWGVADRDVPILIGAAAGAVGLVFLILGAVVIWYCCQFAFQRDKSIYSLENESERGSVSSEGSMQPFSDAVVFMGKKSQLHSDSESNNNAAAMKRSLSAPLNVNKMGSSKRVRRPPPAYTNKLYRANQAYASSDYATDSKASAAGSDFVNVVIDEEPIDLTSNRCHLYRPGVAEELLAAGSGSVQESEVALSLKTRSLPWKRGPGPEGIDEEADENEDSFGDLSPKVNFSKKRKNRMRNDSAAAIALTKSGSSKPFVRNKDTDSLVDNEAVVVYDERTAL